MTHLTYTDMARLRDRHGIQVTQIRRDGTAKCVVDGHLKRYQTADLKHMARWGWIDRIRNWIGGAA